MAEKVKQLGVVPGQPFDVSKLDPGAAASIQQGQQAARDSIVASAKGIGAAEIRRGWVIDRTLGRWGSDYGRRAVAAFVRLGHNAPEDAIFMSARFDLDGKRLDGANRYTLRFDKDAAPPTDAFWSLSLYDDKQQLIANAHNRHNVRGPDGVKANADGSIEIAIQHADPGKAANWLPAPQGAFSLILRVYWPKPEVVDGRWAPPGVRRAS
jgi:hypothetical protein